MARNSTGLFLDAMISSVNIHFFAKFLGLFKKRGFVKIFFLCSLLITFPKLGLLPQNYFQKRNRLQCDGALWPVLRNSVLKLVCILIANEIDLIIVTLGYLLLAFWHYHYTGTPWTMLD